MTTLRYTFRALRRNRELVVAAIASYALGIGVNVTMFRIVDALLLRAPGQVEDASSLARIYARPSDLGIREIRSSFSSFPVFSLVQESGLLESVAAFANTDVVVLDRNSARREARASLVTADYFTVLGVHPFLGWLLDNRVDTQASARDVAVLSYSLWRSAFGASASIIGRNVRVASGSYTVVGVAPPGFEGPDLSAVDLWLPLSVVAGRFFGRNWQYSSGSSWVRLVARLRPGHNLRQVGRQLTTVINRAGRNDSNVGYTTITLGPIQEGWSPEMTQGVSVSLWLAAVSAIVLVMACVNVTSLLLARGLRQERNMMIRMALGATRRQIAREPLAESVVLALSGAVAAAFVASLLWPTLANMLLSATTGTAYGFDIRIVLLSLTVAVATGLLVGVGPSLQVRRIAFDESRIRRVLSASGARRSLVTFQVALSFVLTVGAGLFVVSLRNVGSLRLGLEPDHVIVAYTDRDLEGFSGGDINALFAQIRERVASEEGVASASLGTAVPFVRGMGFAVWVAGRPDPPQLPTGVPFISAVTPEYFATIGSKIVAGRGLDGGDVHGAPEVAIVNLTMAHFLWSGLEPVGQCIRLGAASAPCTHVIGIVEDSRQFFLREDPIMEFFIPLAQHPEAFPDRALFVRAASDTRGTELKVRSVLGSLGPDMPLIKVSSMQDLLNPQVRTWRLGATVFSVFGLLGLGLAAIGVYGVQSFDVARRRREIALRIALGASPAHVVKLVVGGGLRLALLGSVIGALGAIALGRLLSNALFEVSGWDRTVIAVAFGLLLAISTLASLLPAYRAARANLAALLEAE